MLVSVIRRCYICILIDLTKVENSFWKGCITTAELFTLIQLHSLTGVQLLHTVYIFFCDLSFCQCVRGMGQAALYLSIMHTPNQHKHTPQSFIKTLISPSSPSLVDCSCEHLIKPYSPTRSCPDNTFFISQYVQFPFRFCHSLSMHVQSLLSHQAWLSLTGSEDLDVDLHYSREGDGSFTTM